VYLTRRLILVLYVCSGRYSSLTEFSLVLQRDCFLPLLISFVLVYATRNVQENHQVLKLNVAC
jgi:hypothetical protein